MKWDPETTDRVLDTVLAARTPRELSRALHILSEEFPSDRDGNVRRMVWGLATRVKEYTGPATVRAVRTGGITHGEAKMLDWALNSRTIHGGTSPAEYLAALLNRPLAFVQNEIFLKGPAKGRKPLL